VLKVLKVLKVVKDISALKEHKVLMAPKVHKV
jgi:hypothetical protein